MHLRRTLLMALCVGLLALFSAGSASAAAEEATVDAQEDSRGSYGSDSEDSEMSDEWEYDTYYIFPLTRHMPDSELPMAGQIALYPLAFVIDLGQWPIGALCGLAGK
jgi:hypothetical protein